MNFLSFLCILSLFVYLSLGIYAISREPHSPLNRVFFFFAIALAIWTFAYAFVYPIDASPRWIWFWFKLSSLGWISTPAICLHFGLVLTGKDRTMKKWMFALIYLPAVVEIIKINTGILTAQAFELSRFGMVEVISSKQIWFWIHTLYYCSYLLTFFAIVARWGKRSSKLKEKRQARIIVWSGLPIMLPGLMSNLFLPAMGHKFPALSPIMGLIWAFAFLYAINKYKLMSLTSRLVADEILAQVTDMVILADLSGNVLSANNKAADILGYAIDEMKGMPLKQILSGTNLLEEITDKMLIQANTTIAQELNYLSSQDQLIPVRAFFTMVTDKFDDLLGILVVGQDLRLTRKLEQEIREKGLVELALRRSEEQYRDLFENANDMIFLHDLEGNFISCNKAAEKLTGYFRSEADYLNVLDVVVPEQQEMVLNMMAQRTKTQRPSYYQVAIMSKLGTRMELEVSSRPFKGNGEMVAIQSIARDITERKETEEKLRYLSMHDSLTGLYNRAYFSEELNRLENGRCDPVGIIMCDLDGLKTVNDRSGHAAGDQLIINAARLIQSCFRRNDVVARIGGDEFAIVLPHCDESICKSLAGKIQCAVGNFNMPGFMGISVGFAVRTDSSQTMDNLVKKADNAMYADKARRKLRFE